MPAVAPNPVGTGWQVEKPMKAVIKFLADLSGWIIILVVTLAVLTLDEWVI